MKKLPTVRQLQYLVALRKTNHFGQAAEACFVSQSAFSTAIKELETTLEVSLVDRTNRSVVFTLAGINIEQQAQRCIANIDELSALAKSASEPFSGALRIGLIPTVAPYILPNLLPALRTSYPNLELYLKEGQSQQIYQQLISGELDLILFAQPYDAPHTTIHPLFKDPFHFAFSKQSEHSGQKVVDFTELDTDSLLLLEDGHCLRDHALAACNLKDQVQLSQFSANSLYTLVQMVNSNLGVTLLPDMAIDYLNLDKTDISTCELKSNFYRTISLAWREGSSRQSEYLSIANTIESAVIKSHPS
ncbi:MAG: LysR family hydrogen peroxide-inducible transcriptional activator [Saprospiraceae bacterium]|jgi:LysR family hydrogen peroxide-inducible transcriptional activator